MDIVQVLIAAGFGAIFGAFGGIVGHFVGQLLPKQARQPVMILCVVVAGVLSQHLKPGSLASPSGQQLSNQLRKDPLMQLVADNFPERFNGMIARIAENPDEEYAEQQGFQLTSSLRRENADHIWTASAQQIDSYLLRSLDLNQRLRMQYGQDVCSDFVFAGPPGTPQIVEEELDNILALGLALFETILDGRDTPIDRDLSTAGDWSEFFDIWLAADGTSEMLQSVTMPTRGDNALCGAWISMTEQLLSMQTPLADRLKAQLVHLSASG